MCRQAKINIDDRKKCQNLYPDLAKEYSTNKIKPFQNTNTVSESTTDKAKVIQKDTAECDIASDKYKDNQKLWEDNGGTDFYTARFQGSYNSMQVYCTSEALRFIRNPMCLKHVMEVKAGRAKKADAPRECGGKGYLNQKPINKNALRLPQTKAEKDRCLIMINSSRNNRGASIHSKWAEDNNIDCRNEANNGYYKSEYRKLRGYIEDRKDKLEDHPKLGKATAQNCKSLFRKLQIKTDEDLALGIPMGEEKGKQNRSVARDTRTLKKCRDSNLLPEMFA
jgi:hypothetical protein